MSEKYAVIGHPIGHTMSPFIHDRLFKLSGIDAEYSVIDIPNKKLKTEYYSTLKQLDGYNITIPHKSAVIPFLDEIDEKARLYGSVNTVANKNGKAKGYTTDPDGFLKALSYARIPLENRVVILGCGGVARTMAFEALLNGASVEFAVRQKSMQKAENLINEIKTKLKTPDVGFCTINELSGDIDTLINATPVGMSPDIDNLPISEKQLGYCANVFDAIYNPLYTKLIRLAKSNGSNAEGGMSMLVWQAVVAHYHWNKSEYDVKDIEKLCKEAAEELMRR